MALKVSDTMTLMEAAHYLGMTDWNVYRHVSDRKLRAYKVGKNLRFRRKDLDALLKLRASKRHRKK